MDTKNDVKALQEIIDTIENKVRRKGHWICICSTQYWQYNWEHYKCSACGSKQASRSNYCPDCGAKMIKLENNNG